MKGVPHFSLAGLCTMTETTGALVIGANLNGLSIARSLGRRGVPVWVTTPPNIRLASCSRYTLRTLPWPNGDFETQCAYLLDLADRYHLDQWVLYPTSDEWAALLSKFHAALSRRFRVASPTWDVLRWAYDKRLTYGLAAEQQVDHGGAIIFGGSVERCRARDAAREVVDARAPSRTSRPSAGDL